jgi:[acyl-carrier-protein] S-malonyltransferase
MAKLALIFPGQGSQTVGMGKALADAFPVAKAVFNEVDAALGETLSKVIFEGPEADLTATANAQPALMATSLAAFRALQHEAGLDLAKHVACVAGHSLGEYSALAASGALSIADTARLLRMRGNAMQAAVPAGMGAMAALIGAEADVAASVAVEAAQGDICEVANDNGGGQVVISGAKAAIDRAIEIAKAKGVKRAVLLPVSAPFHCSMMAPAAEAMKAALASVQIKPTVVPLYANVLAGPSGGPDAIRDNLVKQVTGQVRWRESVTAMAASGVGHFIEVGSGKVLSGLVKRIAQGVEAISVGTPDDIANARPWIA